MAELTRQERWLQKGLAAFKAHQRDAEGNSYSWKTISEFIKDVTGVPVASENLRRFVDGLEDKKTKVWRYQIPSAGAQQAIRAFLIDYELLSEADFDERAPFQGPWRLSEYLKTDREPELVPQLDKLQGTYRGTFLRERTTVSLTFGKPSPQGLIYIEEEEVRLSDGSPKENHLERIRSAGWAILTPEDTLLVFMKEEPYNENHYLFTLASNLDIWSDVPVNRLVLYRHDYPLEIETNDSDEAAVNGAAIEFVRQLIVLHRVDEVA